MFASKSLIVHAARGAIGLGALAAAIVTGRQPGIVPLLASLLLVTVALVALRGCPMCWTIGLVETVRNRLRPAREPV